MHEEHRKRVRERYFAEGIEFLPEHNVLELLLFYCIPRKDTNELAHRLISAFGSLNGVFSATAEQLMAVEGVGESTAVFLTLLPQIYSRLQREEAKTGRVALDDGESIAALIRSFYCGLKKERFSVLCFDGTGRLLNSRLFDGGFDRVNVDYRELMNFVLCSRGVTVVLCHNHPGFIAAPSQEDVAVTTQIISLLKGVGIRVADHIILGEDGLLSMAHTAKFAALFAG